MNLNMSEYAKTDEFKRIERSEQYINDIMFFSSDVTTYEQYENCVIYDMREFDAHHADDAFRYIVLVTAY